MTETTHGLITDEDARWLIGGCDFVTTRVGDLVWPSSLRGALETTAPRLRARWVAEALDAAAANPTATLWDDAVKRGVPAVSVTDLRVLAAEYRDGTR